MIAKRNDGRGGLTTRRPGRFLVVALLLAASCRAGGDEADRTVRLRDGEVTLDEGARKHVVELAGVQDTAEIRPSRVEAGAGDVVEFTARDALTHSIVFQADSMPAPQADFLRSSGQLRSPPLLTADSRWVVSLKDAPAGEYPFVSALHGGRGVLVVSAAPRSGSK